MVEGTSNESGVEILSEVMEVDKTVELNGELEIMTIAVDRC